MPPGVERGVTGKEKMFQQSRAFGPGAMKPYISQYAEKRSHGVGDAVQYGPHSSRENPGLKGRRYLGPGRLT